MKTYVFFIVSLFFFVACTQDEYTVQSELDAENELVTRSSEINLEEAYNDIPERYQNRLGKDARRFVNSRQFKSLSDYIANTNISSGGATKKWEKTLEEYFEWSFEVANGRLDYADDTSFDDGIELETTYESFETDDLSTLEDLYILMNFRLFAISNYERYSGLRVEEVKVRKTSTGMKFKLVMEAR